MSTYTLPHCPCYTTALPAPEPLMLSLPTVAKLIEAAVREAKVADRLVEARALRAAADQLPGFPLNNYEQGFWVAWLRARAARIEAGS